MDSFSSHSTTGMPAASAHQHAAPLIKPTTASVAMPAATTASVPYASSLPMSTVEAVATAPAGATTGPVTAAGFAAGPPCDAVTAEKAIGEARVDASFLKQLQPNVTEMCVCTRSGGKMRRVDRDPAFHVHVTRVLRAIIPLRRAPALRPAARHR